MKKNTSKMNREDWNKFVDNIRNNYKDIEFEEISSDAWDCVFGIGNIDNGIDDGSGDDDWRDTYSADLPSEEKIELIEKIAKELNLPKPDYYSDTWYNG